MNFCNSDFFEDFKPEHYVLADDIVFSGNKFSPDHEDISKDFLNKINLVDWEIKLYIPTHFKKSWLISKVNNPFVKILKLILHLFQVLHLLKEHYLTLI